MIYFNEKDKNNKQILYEKVFDNNKDAEKYIIITGYTGPKMVKDIEKLTKYKEVILIVGMYGVNINPQLHNAIVKCNNTINNLKVYYTTMLVHTKCYLWYKNEELTSFLIGSANFSSSALLQNPLKETLYEFEDNSSQVQIKNYIDKIFSNMYICTDLDKYKVNTKEKPKANFSVESINIFELNLQLNIDYINNSYLKIEENLIEESMIEVIWDDKDIMLMSKDIVNNNTLITTKDKKELGEYIRKRICNKIGKEYTSNKQITIEELKKYGRDYITVIKVEEGIYSFDFSI